MDKATAKISVSLPEALKAQLDSYADEHGLSVSQTVQLALEGLFQPVQPPPGPGDPGQDIARLEQMVGDLSAELTQTRQVLDRHRDYLLALRPLLDIAGIAATLPPSAFP